jgi:transmembrane sensor
MKMNKELIEKYLNNRLSKDELDQVVAWFREKAGSEGGEALLHEFWEGLDDDPLGYRSDFDSILNKIHHQVNLHQAEKLMTVSHDNLIRYNRRQAIYHLIRNTAAIMLIPVLALGLYFAFRNPASRTVAVNETPVYYEVSASVDAVTRVTLPDGSGVLLNRGSSLRYPAIFAKKNREVELKGEGYFDVVHNPDIPFIVQADEIKVVAHGTAFNVMAYPGENNIETSLVNGSIELFRTKQDRNDQYLTKMNPAEMAIFRKTTHDMGIHQVSDDRYYAWKEGKLVFINESIDAVVRKLSRWYNVDLQIKDKKLMELSYTATFVNETLSQALELMALATPIRYSISDRQEISEGVYSKRQVILRYRNK